MIPAGRPEPVSKSLERTNSFRIGGLAREFYAPRSVDELASVLETLRGRRPFFLGGGCNTLFPDGDFSRPVVSTVGLRRVDVQGDSLLAECGSRLGSIIGSALDGGLGGLEHFVGIPGTVGGAVAMNAGGGGHSFGDLVEELGVFDVETGEFAALRGDEVPWGYRSWNLDGLCVAWARLRLRAESPSVLKARARELFFRKRSSQPLSAWSAGCIFRNPPGLAAAKLIDDLGLKGLAHGAARVSGIHANFIVNEGRATSRDVRGLIETIRSRVRSAYGVELETEVVLAGEESVV